MAIKVTAQSPSAGYIAWTGANISYKGSTYAIADGNTNFIYVYWLMSDPTHFYGSNTYPTLGVDDILVFVNKNGVPLIVPNTTVIDGSLVVPQSLTANAIAADTITSAQIAANTITATELAAGAVTANAIAANAIGANAIAANAVVAGKIAANAVTAGTIAANAVAAGTIAANAVTSSTIAANAIGASAIAAGAITADKMNVTSLSAIAANLGTVTAGTISGVTISGSTIQEVDAATGNYAKFYMPNGTPSIENLVYTNNKATQNVARISGAQVLLEIDNIDINGAITNVVGNLVLSPQQIKFTNGGTQNIISVDYTNWFRAYEVDVANSKTYDTQYGSRGISHTQPFTFSSTLIVGGSVTTPSVEVRNTSTIPYIDFSDNAVVDFKTRIALSGGTNFAFTVASGQVMYLEQGSGATIFRGAGVRTVFLDSSATLRIESVAGGSANLVVATVNGSSDRALKKNISLFDKSGLDEINTTPIQYYNFNDEVDNVDPRHVGIILQEAPIDVVDPRGQGVDLYGMIALSWKAIQELSARDAAQQTEIDGLKAQLSDQETRIAALEQKLTAA